MVGFIGAEQVKEERQEKEVGGGGGERRERERERWACGGGGVRRQWQKTVVSGSKERGEGSNPEVRRS